MSADKNIPVEAAKRIAEVYGKSHVVILAYDKHAEMTYTATYGVEAQDKVQAARLGDILTTAAGADIHKSTMYEDFRRDFDAGRLKQAEELLLSAGHALRSYQYGNGSGDLAKDVAEAIEKFKEQKGPGPGSRP